MATLDLKKSSKGKGFLAKLKFFGTKVKTGDQMVFDRRGAIRITEKEVTQKNGEVVRIRGIADAGSGSDPMVIHRPTNGGDGVDASRAMGAHYSWPYAAIKAISEEISNIEFKVYRTKKNGEDEEVDEHELIDFLETVNDFQTSPEFKQMISQHLELTGNAYIYLEGVKNYNGKPVAMYLLDPGSTRIVIDKRTFPYKIVGYDFTFDGKKRRFQPYEIVQLKDPNPNNPYVGKGSVQGSAEWIDNDNNTTEFQRQFFINGAQIGQIFETDMSSEEQIQMLKDSFMEQHASVKNSFKAMFLPKGVKKPAGNAGEVKIGDIGISEIADNNRDKILSGFRVSKTILGTAESETNRATAETADYVFAKRVIKPKMIRICSYLNEFLTPRFGSDIYITFEDPVPEDKANQMAEMTAAVGGKQVITQNEAREVYMGLGPIEGGDTLDSGSSSTMQYDLTKSKKLPKKIAYRPKTNKAGKTQFARSIAAREHIAASLTDKIAAIFAVTSKAVDEMTKEEYESVILKEKRERIDKYTDEMKLEIKRLNGEQGDEVMKNLEEATKSQKAIVPSDLFDVKEWINIFVTALTPITRRMFKVEADHALQLVDKPGIDVANTPNAKRAVDEAMNLLSTSYNQTTIDALTDKINEGLAEGYGAQKLGQIVSDIYAWSDETRAERVALTESNRIANTASKIAWKESGVVHKIQWVTSKRDNVCPFCQEQDGKVISIDKNFFDEGDTIHGDDGAVMTADYSDVGGPPLHPNCHCAIRPIVSSKMQIADILPDDKEADNIVAELLQGHE